ncbi:MAG TPA: C25 family cysteine peptidase, partial [Bacteroidales bacterium]|nr:C25 family cysteine peptidase [Bacteroidales bacterium]
MKKSILFVLIVLCFNSIIAQNWMEFTASESTTPDYNILQSNDTIVKFSVFIPGMFETSIDTFNRVNIKEHTRLDSVGFPEIPIVSFLVAIPQCDSVNMQITILDSTQFSGYNIYPAPELVPDTTEGGAIALVEQFAYYRAAYETDVLFPGYIGETLDKGAIRAQNVVRVLLYPVQFNPVKKTIKAYSDLQITLTFNNPSGSINKDIGIFNEVGGNTLINYESNGLNASISCGAGLENSGSWFYVDDVTSQKINSACDYLLITHDSLYFTEAGQKAIDSLAAHRAHFNGFDVAIITTSVIDDDIIPIGLPLKIKIFKLIENTYNSNNANHTYDGKLAYLNLFGDAYFDDTTVCIPTDGEGYDVYFTQLTQTNGAYDSYPDIMLGRCSVDTVTQVQNVVAKILNFNPNAYRIKNQCLLYSGNDTKHYENINKEFVDIKSIFPGDSIYFITPNNFDSIYYHPDWVLKKPYMLETVLDVYKKELSVFQYSGHGSSHDLGAHSFRYEDLTINHNDKFPFGYFNACLTGTFHLHDDCFCEKMLNQSTNRGMIATVGANEVVGMNVNRGHSLINSLYYNSSVIGSAYLETQFKVPSTVNNFNLFGDPALNLFYENIDTLKADIIVQKLSAIKSVVNQEDTLRFTAIISNLMNVDINVDFVTSCYLRQVGDPDYVLAASITTSRLDAFDHDSLDFFIPANQFVQDFYECKVMVDTAGIVDELSKLNNSAVIAVTILNLTQVNIEEKINSTIVPVSYNMLNLADSNQIVAGTQIFTYDGSIVRNIEHEAGFYAGLGNAISGNVTFINTFSNAFEDINIASYTMDSVWSKSPVSNEGFGQPCMGFIDNTGDDFIFFNEIYYADTNWRYNLTCLDYKCNQKWKIEDFSRVYSISPDIQIAGLLFVPVVYFDKELNTYRIITITKNGEIYFVEENQNGQPFIADSLIIEGCSGFLSQLIAGVSGINQEIKFGVSFTDSNGKKCM